MADPDTPPVVTVLHNTPQGVMVRWFRTLNDARNQRCVLSATSGGVTVGMGAYLTDIPEAWVVAARQAYEMLKAGGDVSGLATHRGRFGDSGGPLDPVQGANQDD